MYHVIGFVSLYISDGEAAGIVAQGSLTLQTMRIVINTVHIIQH